MAVALDGTTVLLKIASHPSPFVEDPEVVGAKVSTGLGIVKGPSCAPLLLLEIYLFSLLLIALESQNFCAWNFSTTS